MICHFYPRSIFSILTTPRIVARRLDTSLDKKEFSLTHCTRKNFSVVSSETEGTLTAAVTTATGVEEVTGGCDTEVAKPPDVGCEKGSNEHTAISATECASQSIDATK